jgi:hypothetical protein
MQSLDITFFKPLNTFMSSATATKLRENPGQRLSTEHIASLVDMAFPRAATMETAMNGFKNSGLWHVDRNVFMDADFAPSAVTHATHVAKPATPKENPENNGYIPVQKISPLPSNSAERTKSRKKRSASGVVLTGTPHKDSLNGANIAASLGAKPKKKRLFATAKVYKC